MQELERLKRFGLKEFRGLESMWEFIQGLDELDVLRNPPKGGDASELSKILRQTVSIIAYHCRVTATMKLNSTLVQAILADTRPYVRAALLLNEKCSATEVILLLGDISAEVAEFVASHPKVKLLEKRRCGEVLLGKNQRRVADALIQNADCPVHILKMMAQDPNERRLQILASNPTLPKEVFDLLSLHTDTTVLARLAENKNLPPEFCNRLALTSDFQVRSVLADRLDIEPSLLGKLSMDSHVRVRAVASNRLEGVLRMGGTRLTEWCHANLGVSSPRFTNLVQRSIPTLSPMGWMAILADFLRRVYGTNTSEYFDMLERLSCEAVASNISGSSEVFQGCPFLEASFSGLTKTSIERILRSDFSKERLSLWSSLKKDMGNSLLFVRPELKEGLKKQEFRSMDDLLRIAGQIIENKYNELKIFKTHSLPLAKTLFNLHKIKLDGELAHLTIHTPKTLQELVEVGGVLKNCLRNKDTALRYGHSTRPVFILRSSSDKRPVYVVQVDSDGAIQDMKGKCNRPAPKRLQKGLQSAILKATPRQNILSGARSLARQLGQLPG